MKSKEDHLRSLFAQNRNSYELNDPHVMLYELGANLSRFMINTTPVLILSAHFTHIYLFAGGVSPYFELPQGAKTTKRISRCFPSTIHC